VGTAAELKRRVTAQRLDLTCANPEAWAQVRSLLANRVVHLDPAARTVGVATDGSAAQVRALLDQADPGRDLVASFAVRGATLDDVFFTLTAPAPEAAHV
jgi:ABC-2 type transport system ATP-binding protein